MTTPAELASLAAAPGWSEKYSLFTALRAGQPLPPDVAWSLTCLLTQVAVTVHEADTGRLEDASRGALLGWLDALGRAEHNLMDEWGLHHG